MTFDEAMASMQQGVKVRRGWWPWNYIFMDNFSDTLWFRDGSSEKIFKPKEEDFSANDWEIVPSRQARMVAKRMSAGDSRNDVWLSASLTALLDSYRAMKGVSRAEAIREILASKLEGEK